MNEDTIQKLEAAVATCATRAVDSNTTPLGALQYTQAAVNASNAIIGLETLKTQQK